MASPLQAALRRPPPPLYGELFRCFSALPPRIARAQGPSRAAETAFTHAWTSTRLRRGARTGSANDGESIGRTARTTSGPSWLAKRTTHSTGTAWTLGASPRQLSHSILAIDARRYAAGSRRPFSSSSLRWTAAGPGDGTGSPSAATPTPPRPPDKPNSALPPNGAARDTETHNNDGRLHSLAKVEPHPLIAPHPAYLSSLSRSIRRAASALPTVAGRPPPKEQLLSLTNSFFERLKIRFKWATIRSYRRFRADDYSAFFSFGIMGTLGWFLLSTTSAFAVFFFLVNSLSLQEWLASKLGAYLTDSTGVKVVFESAIVPKWGLFGQSGSKIVFRNVYISRGPVKGELGILPADQGQVEETEEQAKLREQMAKWTHFHLSIDTVEVSLSLGRWLDGKGLIKDAAVRGVRGVIERSHIVYDPTAVKDRFQYRNKPRPGDFWLEGLKIEDFLVTIYQPDHFRPYTFSIFNADIPRFRKQWLFYDLMSAEAVTGQVDNCLFSLHKPQSIGTTSEEDLKNEGWSRMSRFRCDGIPIDHMQTSNDTGVLSWITSGRCDLVADIRFPRQDDQVDLSAIVDHLVDEIGGRLGAPAAATHNRTGPIPGRRSLSRDALEAPRSEGHELTKKEERRRALQFAKEAEKVGREREQQRFATLDDEDLQQERDNEMEAPSVDDEEDKIVSIDLDIRFRDLKASVPYFTSDLSYINNALVRPIVAFINRNRTLIPIRCHIDLGLSEFNGSWTTYDVGILDRMSEQVYEALAHHVAQSNDQRIQTVGLWTLQMTASSVLSALKNNFTLAPY